MKSKFNSIQNSGARIVDIAIASLSITILLPCWAINVLLSLVKKQHSLQHSIGTDSLNRNFVKVQFNCGIFRSSANLLQVIRGSTSLVGLSENQTLSLNTFSDQQKRDIENCNPGLLSLVDLYHWVGRIDTNLNEIILRQISISKSFIGYFVLVMTLAAAHFLYGQKRLRSPETFSIFGLSINNDSLSSALDWIESTSSHCKTGFFINVNSINLSRSNLTFHQHLKSADRNFADGSGMRIAASHIGIHLSANLNGTDLLPHICNRHINSNKSIFLLGAKPGIAEMASEKLISQFPGLNIAGHFHGYFDKENCDEVIDLINASGAHTLLVAFGSPIQEEWLINNKNRLHCSTALAVGGLFDFTSGKISRAPDWLRAIGMEWIWRLKNEPIKKFNRYVIGNPLFIINTLILNRVGEPS